MQLLPPDSDLELLFQDSRQGRPAVTQRGELKRYWDYSTYLTNSHQSFNKLLDFRHSEAVVLVLMRTSLTIRHVNKFGLEFSS